GHSASKAFSAVVLERIGDVIILMLLALASVGSVFLQVNALQISCLGLGIAVVLGALVVCERVILRFAARLRFRLLSRFLQQFVTHAATSVRTRSFYIAQL